MAPLAVPLALALDAVVGEPPRRLHPVAWFGSAVAPFDRDWTRPVAVGLLVAAGAPLLAATVVGFLVGAVGSFAPTVGGALAGLVLFVTTSWRRLLGRARSTIDASERDLARARVELPALVGRDPGTLSAGQVRSAAVESTAENLADGLVAPLLAFAVAGTLAGGLGVPASLAVAAAAATWVKAVNTLDSMVGYPDKPHGWASARLDDVVMWVPSRVAAVLLALVVARPRALVSARSWTAGVPSPNAGWPMGTIAVIADCRLEKPGTYVLNDGTALPDVERARTAVRIVARAGLAAYAFAALIASLGVLAWS